jgi:hypothetical protein
MLQQERSFDQHDHDNSSAIYNMTLDDSRLSIKTVYTSLTGIWLTTVTASLSALTSMLLIFIIFRSTTKLGSIYHRILFGMSFYDIIESLAMALTTIPMPKDMIYEQFEGLIVGTENTCTAQGFLFQFGSPAATAYNAILCWYYLFVFHFQMKEDKIKKYCELAFHITPFGVAMTSSFLSFKLDGLHPSPLATHCGLFKYPFWCSTDEGNCLHDEGFDSNQIVLALQKGATIYYGVVFATAFLSLLAVVFSVYRRERRFRESIKEVTSVVDERTFVRIKAYRKDLLITKSIMKQALYYILAFVAVNFFPFVNAASFDLTSSEETSTVDPCYTTTSSVLQILQSIFRPSRGLFNLLIFVQHKMWGLRRKHTYARYGFWELLKEVVFCGKEAEEVVVSSLYIVRMEESLKMLELKSSNHELFAIPLALLPQKSACMSSNNLNFCDNNVASSSSTRGGGGSRNINELLDFFDSTGGSITGSTNGQGISCDEESKLNH